MQAHVLVVAAYAAGAHPLHRWEALERWRDAAPARSVHADARHGWTAVAAYAVPAGDGEVAARRLALARFAAECEPDGLRSAVAIVAPRDRVAPALGHDEHAPAHALM